MDSARKPQGFTLIELMVVIAVLGIFAAIAVPNFTQFVKNNQIQSVSNEAYSLLQYARATAVSNREALSVCIDDQVWSVKTSCSEGGATTLREIEPPAKVLLSATRTAIDFNANGTAAATKITVCQEAEAGNGYTIEIKPTGHIRQFARGKKDADGAAMSTCKP